MTQLGYDEEDAFLALSQLVKWNLVEPESLIIDELRFTDPVQIHSSGFTHMRYFLQQPEYVVGVSAEMSFSSFEIAKNIASVWTQSARGEPRFKARQRILTEMRDYAKAEYARRVRRHPFYEDLGHGGKIVTQSLDIALSRTTGTVHRTRGPVRYRPPRPQ